MWASFRAEWLKLRKRQAVQVLVLLSIAIAFFFNYAIPYWRYQGAQGGVSMGGDIAEQALLRLLPGELIRQTFNGTFVANLLTLILGVLVAGSEYGWGTLKTVLTRRPGRVAVFGGKVLALGGIVTMIVLAIFAMAAAASALVAATEGDVARHASAPALVAKLSPLYEGGGAGVAEQEAAQLADQLPRALFWPPLLDIGKAVGATWLILAAFAAFGLFLATLARGTALAIGVGLVWLLVIEGEIAFDVSIPAIRGWLLSETASALAISLTDAGGRIVMSTTRAALVLGGYTLLFIMLGALVFRRRDVT
jgi:ABC-type transport system involved in multi-copper enzyme maturation permease subunit